MSESARRALAAVARDDHGRLLALLIRELKDFALAEDALHDAMEAALVHWPRTGPPASPAGWLLQAARRKAIDRIRRAKAFEAKAAEMAYLMDVDQEPPPAPEAIPDERLRLIYTCCHPALDEKTRIALCLRTLCGLTTEEIARAFLDKDDAMAQRLVRARHKIAKAGIAYEVPEAGALPARRAAVLAVIYLTFNEGYSASAGDDLQRPDLCEEAIRLARLVADDAEGQGLLALLLLTHSRRRARAAPGGFVALENQDRSLWDGAMTAEGTALLEAALARRRPGPYQLQAAIAAVHAEARSHAETRWREIMLLYGRLFALSPNIVYRLNRAVAQSYCEGPAAALVGLDEIAGDLELYQPYHAARADMLRRLDRPEEAARCYRRAIALGRNAPERRFLEARLAGLAAGPIMDPSHPVAH